MRRLLDAELAAAEDPEAESNAEHEDLHDPIDGVFIDLFSAVREPPEFVIKDLLPVGLTFIGAPPKSGKSTQTLAMALLVAGFKCNALPPFLSEVPETGRVFMFSAEATAGELLDMVEEGLKVKGEANEGILVADDPFQWRLDDPDGLDRLLHWLRMKRPKLVLIDPLRDFHSLEEKDSGEMNRLLRPLQRYAKEHKAAVVIVHHVRKKQKDDGSGSDDASYSPEDMRGSSALHGIADGVLMVTPLAEGYVRMRAQFKRAPAWDRTFRVAAYQYAGEGAENGGKAAEKLGEVERMVLRAVENAAQGVSGLPKQGLNSVTLSGKLKLTLGRTQEAMQVLLRNGLITMDKYKKARLA